MAGKYLLCTLGCKVNQYESQQVRELVESMGFRPVGAGERPDFALVNTCAVTADAARKNRQAIRRASHGGQTPVIVVGCGASAEPGRMSQLDGVAAVIGHDRPVSAELRTILATRFELPTAGSTGFTPPATGAAGERHDPGETNVWMIPDAAQASTPRSSHSPRAIISDPLPIVKTDDALVAKIESFAGHQRAFLKVQDGCDAHCTYCIIPQLRQNLRSKPVDVAVQEARQLVAAGHKEIVITGIFLGAYGRPTALRKRFSDGPSPLAALILALSEVDGLQRLRLSSLEPGDVDDSLLEVLATRPSCVPHLHLPLQSASPRILRRMNRQYTRDAFIALIDRVHAALNRPAITTDVIVGFPGETDCDFDDTVELARYAGFCKIHALPFSPRDKTAAARWQREFVPRPVVQMRMRRLAEIDEECSLAYRRSLVGMADRVIIEGVQEVAPGLYACSGRTDRYLKVWFDSDTPLAPGELAKVRIDRATPTRTHATRLKNRAGYSFFVLSNSLA